MKIIVDRIEEGIAVCQDLNDGKIIEISLSELPFTVAENSQISIKENGEYVLDDEGVSLRHQRIKEKFEELLKRKLKKRKCIKRKERKKEQN